MTVPAVGAPSEYLVSLVLIKIKCLFPRKNQVRTHRDPLMFALCAASNKLRCYQKDIRNILLAGPAIPAPGENLKRILARQPRRVPFAVPFVAGWPLTQGIR